MQYKNLGKFIRIKREKLKVSLNSFAVEIELDSAVLSRIETMQQGIKLDALEKIAKGFKISVPQLLIEFDNSKIK